MEAHAETNIVATINAMIRLIAYSSYSSKSGIAGRRAQCEEAPDPFSPERSNEVASMKMLSSSKLGRGTSQLLTQLQPGRDKKSDENEFGPIGPMIQ
jgi:hypothetical protein